MQDTCGPSRVYKFCCIFLDLSPGFTWSSHLTSRLSQEFQQKRLTDISFWRSQYHIFVTWSVCGTHEWDGLQKPHEYIVLEIGLSAKSQEPILLLGGQEIRNFSFSNGVLRTRCVHPLPASGRPGDAQIIFFLLSHCLAALRS